MDYNLSQKELEALRKAHRATRDRRLADRIKVVYDLGRGKSAESIADYLMMDETTVRNYFAIYKEKGINGLLVLHHAGRTPYLTADQKEQLTRFLDENILTSTKEVIAYIHQTFGVRYKRSGVTKLLHELGFSYKKPKKIPGKANRQLQEEFIAEYHLLRKNAYKDDVFLFMDGCHPMFNSIAASGWIRKGKDKELKSNTGRQRLNINGAFDIKTMSWVVDLPQSVNAQSTITLFKKMELIYTSSRKIYVIADNARYYRSKLVSEYLAGSKIELIFLPAYSPNLNLIERFWKFFKKKVLNNRYYETYEMFVKSCQCFFRQRKRHEGELRTLMTENFQLFES
jgi:transposase